MVIISGVPIFRIFTVFSTRFSLKCKVYTGYHGTSETEHGLCASLKLGDYLSVQAHKPCSFCHIRPNKKYVWFRLQPEKKIG